MQREIKSPKLERHKTSQSIPLLKMSTQILETSLTMRLRVRGTQIPTRRAHKMPLYLKLAFLVSLKSVK